MGNISWVRALGLVLLEEFCTEIREERACISLHAYVHFRHLMDRCQSHRTVQILTKILVTSRREHLEGGTRKILYQFQASYCVYPVYGIDQTSAMFFLVCITG